jgi:hypothetical protein
MCDGCERLLDAVEPVGRNVEPRERRNVHVPSVSEKGLITLVILIGPIGSESTRSGSICAIRPPARRSPSRGRRLELRVAASRPRV